MKVFKVNSYIILLGIFHLTIQFLLEGLHITFVCGITGESLHEGIEWLNEKLNAKNYEGIIDSIENTEINIKEENLNQIKEIFISINECNNSIDKKDFDEKLKQSKEVMQSFEKKINSLNDNDDSLEEI